MPIQMRIQILEFEVYNSIKVGYADWVPGEVVSSEATAASRRILSWVGAQWNISPHRKGSFNMTAFMLAVFDMILSLFVDQIFKYAGL